MLANGIDEYLEDHRVAVLSKAIESPWITADTEFEITPLGNSQFQIDIKQHSRNWYILHNIGAIFLNDKILSHFRHWCRNSLEL